MTVTAQDIAAALTAWRRRQDPKTPDVTLTAEQTEVIEATTAGPVLVTAGAGSGKTETMSLRILWLVANNHARLDQILGMTFTRRAAASLAKRLREGLEAIRHEMPHAVEPQADGDMFASSITTYNAFANRIVQEFGHLVGYDSSNRVITETTAWLLARDIVINQGDPSVAALDMDVDTLTTAVLKLARSLTDNMTSSDAVRAFADEFIAHVEPLPITARGSRHTSPQESYKRGLEAARRLRVLAGLAAEYQRAKRERRYLEFADQIEIAYRLAQLAPVRQSLEATYPFVLLDEYQDTSSVQVALLSSLFGHQVVMAVGDPNQAIYAWRGASAANMQPHRFFASFVGPDAGGREASHLESSVTQREKTLSTSWRNPPEVLAAANTIAQVLTTTRSDGSSFLLRSRDDAPSGRVELTYDETIADEARSVATWFTQRFTDWADKEKRPTGAVLCRNVADLLHFKLALESLNLRTHVAGLGGLLMEPVIVDLVCALRVAHNARADSELIRLLAGARWRIAPRDLKKLNATARWLSVRDHRLVSLSPEVQAAMKQSVSASDGDSLIDALDFLASVEPDHEALQNISPQGIERMRDAGAVIARLRRRASIDLRELVRYTLSELRLDVELLANDTLRHDRTTLIIESFLDVVDSFTATTESVTLGSFLAWLETAERRERLSPVEDEPEGDVVQLLTIHGAKGLEWDFVAVGRMVAETSQTEARHVEKWLDAGTLPEQLRADVADLGTVWEFKDLPDQVTLGENFDAYKTQATARYREGERRLAYVALTRAKRDILLSGSWWASGKTRRTPNTYISEVSENGLAEQTLPTEPTLDENPWDPRAGSPRWPLPPLDSRENRVRLAHAAVMARWQSEGGVDLPPGEAFLASVSEDIELLLAERERRGHVVPPTLPRRIPASRFKEYIAAARAAAGAPLARRSNEDSVERSVSPWDRRLPEKPYRATVLGTLFHSWVETRAIQPETTTLFDLEDWDADEGDSDSIDGTDAQALATLRATFESSPWAELRPFAVETEIHLPLGGHVIICKLDAVFKQGQGDDATYDVVDWKTGKLPADADDLEARGLQLALYRAAFAALTGVSADRIGAAFYFVAEDTIIRPERLPGVDELERVWIDAVRVLTSAVE